MKYFLIGYLGVVEHNYCYGNFTCQCDIYPNIFKIKEILLEEGITLAAINFINELTKEELEAYSER